MPCPQSPARPIRLGVGLVLALLAIALTAWFSTEADAQSAEEPPPELTCSADAATISWNDADQNRYWIYRSTPDSPDFQWVGRTLGETTFADPFPTIGARYQVRFAGASRHFACETIAEPASERAPFSCSVSGGDLEWIDHDQPTYWVYRSTDGGDTFVWLGRTFGETTFRDPNPAAANPPRYQVHYAGIPRTECTNSEGPDVSVAASLQAAQDCASLLEYFRTEAGARVNAYGLDSLGWVGGPLIEILPPGGPTVTPLPTATALPLPTSTPGLDAPTAPAPGAREGIDFSGTTLQELGIDEPDIVKTDGDRILVVSNNEFIVVDTREDQARIAGRVEFEIEGRATEMLIVENRALLFGQGWDFRNPRGGGVSILIDVDFTTEAAPVVTAEMAVEGQYVSARLAGGVARVVVQSNPNRLPFVYPYNGYGEETALETNQRVVAESTLEDWLPTFSLDVAGEQIDSGLLTDCDAVYTPSSFSGFGSLSVLSFDLTAPLGDGAATSIMASGDTVYASDKSMYIATNNWFDPALNAEERALVRRTYSTSIHRFDVTEAMATYTASGSVRGHLLNQFSMSEHDDRLRVATTDGSPWDGSSESFVHVLETDADELVVVGSVGNMGRGERIRSVRYAGDIAYVVTFRQTDPFYTVDLSDPTDPVVRGELKITGYSGQLHPIGDNLVLGVGQEATAQGLLLGAKVTLFDVSDLDDPVDLDTWTFYTAQTSAEWDHRAFLWWAPESLAVIPVSSWRNDFRGAIAFKVDRESGISEFGRISHAPEGDENLDARRTDPILRTLVIGDELWTLSSRALHSNRLADLDRTQRLPFD